MSCWHVSPIHLLSAETTHHVVAVGVFFGFINMERWWNSPCETSVLLPQNLVCYQSWPSQKTMRRPKTKEAKAQCSSLQLLGSELLTQPLSIGPMIRRPELCVAGIWCLVRGKHCLSIAISETFDSICFRLSSYAVAMLSQFCVWGCWKRSKVCSQGNDLPVPWGSRCIWGRADWTFVSHLVHRRISDNFSKHEPGSKNVPVCME